MRLKEYFHDPEEENDDTEENRFGGRSSWVPLPNRDAVLETYITTIDRDIFIALPTKKKTHDNLTSQEREVLRSLTTKNDFVIKVKCHLNNKVHYLNLDKDLTQCFSLEIKEFLAEMTNCCSITEELIQILLSDDTRISRFHILPKIHKPGSPGRSIMSSCGSPTEGISHFMDFHLCPLLRKIPSHIKDTNDFLNKLESLGNLPLGTILVSFDVTALYTKIPNSDGIDACRAMLNTRDVQ